MADLPEGSNIIPNPYNRIPGFSLAMHYFLPGFPTMAWPMMEWVLDSHYAYLNQPPQKELSITVFGVYESHLLELMQKFVNHYPELRFSSLPSINEMEPRIELSVRGDNLQVTDAMNFLKQGIGALGVKWNENVP